MDHKSVGELAGVVACIAYIVYVLAIFFSVTKPSRVTWLVWAFVNVIMCWSYRDGGAQETWWVSLIHAGGCLVIFLVILLPKKGEANLKDLALFPFSKKKKEDRETAIDFYCLAGAAIGLCLWQVLNSPGIALGMCIAADACGLGPTFKKSWLRPKDENLFAWTLSTLAAVINLFAVPDWSWDSLFVISYTVYVAIGIGAVWLILVIRRLQKISATPTPK